MPEGTVDVIPVDMVAAAICAVAARGPANEPAGKPDVVQVASGSVNPLKYRRLVDLCQEWFTERPLYDAEGQPIVVPEWSFPGRGRVQGQLLRAKRTLERRRAGAGHCCRSGASRPSSRARIEEKREQAERALSYVELYGAYAECEAIYGVERLLELSAAHGARGPRAVRRSTRASSTGTTTSTTSTCRRWCSTPASAPPAAAGRAPTGRTACGAQVLSPERHLAAFDLENTLIASNVVASYAWLATRRLPREDRVRFVARTLAEAPSLLALDRKDRGDFLRHFYRRYEDAPVAQIRTRRGRAVQRPHPHQVVPRRHPARARAPGARAPHAAHHRRARLRRSSRCGRCSTTSCAPAAQRAAGRDVLRRAHRRAADRRGPRPGHVRLRRGRGARPRRVGGLRRLGVRPPDARSGRLPRGREPRDPPGRHRPQARAGWSSTSTRRPAGRASCRRPERAAAMSTPA